MGWLQTRPVFARRRRRRRAVLLAILVVGAVAAVLVWQQRSASEEMSAASPTWRSGEPTSSGAVAASAAPPPTTGPRYDIARQQLKALPVRGWGPHLGLPAPQFGPAWSDDVNVEFGRNGCNTRDDILRRDLKSLVVRPYLFRPKRHPGRPLHRSHHRVRPAVRRPPTASRSTTWSLSRMPGTRAPVAWDPQRRLDFANDLRNLLAVSPEANFEKAFRDAASWLPANAGFR